MKSSGNPPPPPDPTLTANAQSGANTQTAIANARLNRVNQTTPWGSITYTEGPRDANGVPTWSSNIALSPQQQALLEQQQGGQLTRAQLANQVLANSGSNIARPLDLSHLQSVYDPYSASHQWEPSPISAPAAQAAPAPAAQGSSGQSIDPAMLAQLVAMLRQAPASAGPAASSAPAGAPPAPMASAPAAQAQGDPFGTWGNLKSYIGTTKPDTSKLPPEIAAQLQDDVRVDEGGAQSHNYSFNQNPWGGFKDADGKVWVQVGDPATNKAGDGGIKDRSKVVYKPGAGYVTTPDNLNNYGTGGMDLRMLLAVVGLGLGGAALGVGADAAGGAGAAAGAAGDESLGLAGTGTYAGGGASAAPGAFDVGGSTGFGGTTPLDGAAANYAPVTDLSTQAPSQSVWQQLLQNIQSGKGVLGYGNGATRTGIGLLPQLIRGYQGGGKK